MIKSHKSFGNRLVRKSLLPGLCLAWLAGPFAARAQFTLTTNNGTITVSAYSGTSASVVIPAMTNGLPVVSVASYTFEDNGTVTSVTIPVNVTNIGTYAFYYCTNLTSVSMPFDAHDPRRGCLRVLLPFVERDAPGERDESRSRGVHGLQQSVERHFAQWPHKPCRQSFL